MNKYFGNKDFYIKALSISLPMIIQNLITNFVSMLDNIMVGQIGTAQMSGVSIINQFMFVFNITIFGAVSGASIFGTQFYGKQDHEGQKYTVRFRMVLCTIVLVLSALILLVFNKQLIYLFLSSDDSPQMILSTYTYAREYLSIMIIGLIPFSYGQAYSSVVRECGETKIPMYSSAAAILINVVLDYGLIFGKLGMPCMGVKGAAIATVIAKIAEAAIVIIWAHANTEKNKYIKGLYASLYIPKALSKDILIKGCPLLINEFLWAFGMSVIAQCYSVRGIDVVAARNISSTITNLFNVVFVQLGAAAGIILGNLLGAGKMKEAKEDSLRLIVLNETLTILFTLIMIPVAGIFPQSYNTELSVKSLSTYFIIISAIAMPIWAYTNVSYFIIRSGGKTGITFLFDFVFTWVIMIPLAFILCNFTSIDIHSVFAIVTFSELLKAIAGYLLVKSGIWIQNIVDDV